ncbi:ribonuclease HI family protein [Candidatus Amesbacteria bacterium]|nr:ribonuclease HI family protein [Candidatus Amesbacteria bacterium]
MDTYQIFTDGGSRGNPGYAACAFVVYDSQNKLIFQKGISLGVTTNNVAEYSAVLRAVEWLPAGSSASFKLDSLLVVQQLNGVFKIKDNKLQELSKIILLKIVNCKLKISFVHIPREKNVVADLLVNKTLDGEHENE